MSINTTNVRKSTKNVRRMEVYSFHIVFLDNGAHMFRAEWGFSRRDALKILCSLYGEYGVDFICI